MHSGPTPGYSPALGAWAITVDNVLRIADDANGDQIWLTRAEAAETQAKASEDRAKTAEAEIERLQALLKKQQT